MNVVYYQVKTSSEFLFFSVYGFFVVNLLFKTIARSSLCNMGYTSTHAMTYTEMEKNGNDHLYDNIFIYWLS